MVKEYKKISFFISFFILSFTFSIGSDIPPIRIELKGNKVEIKGSNLKTLKFGKDCKLESQHLLRCSKRKNSIILYKKRDIHIIGSKGEVFVEDIIGKISLNCITCNFTYIGKSFFGNLRIINGNINIKTKKVRKLLVAKTTNGNISLSLRKPTRYSIFLKTNYGKLITNDRILLKKITIKEKPIPQKTLFFNKGKNVDIRLFTTYGNIILNSID